MGSAWLFEAVSHKFHACCHGLHAMLEAISSLKGFGDDIEQVTITSHPRWDRVCNNPKPETGLQAKFSFRLTAAMALSGLSTARLDSFSDDVARDAGLAELRDRVVVEFDETLPETAARVELRTNAGVFQASHDLTQPMSLKQRSEKVLAKSAAMLGSSRSAKIEAAIDDGDLNGFVALLGDIA
jgi:2-methylcitrate dehydratase PrpD